MGNRPFSHSLDENRGERRPIVDLPNFRDSEVKYVATMGGLRSHLRFYSITPSSIEKSGMIDVSSLAYDGFTKTRSRSLYRGTLSQYSKHRTWFHYITQLEPRFLILGRRRRELVADVVPTQLCYLDLNRVQTIVDDESDVASRTVEVVDFSSSCPVIANRVSIEEEERLRGMMEALDGKEENYFRGVPFGRGDAYLESMCVLPGDSPRLVTCHYVGGYAGSLLPEERPQDRCGLVCIWERTSEMELRGDFAHPSKGTSFYSTEMSWCQSVATGTDSVLRSWDLERLVLSSMVDRNVGEISSLSSSSETRLLYTSHARGFIESSFQEEIGCARLWDMNQTGADALVATVPFIEEVSDASKVLAVPDKNKVIIFAQYNGWVMILDDRKLNEPLHTFEPNVGESFLLGDIARVGDDLMMTGSIRTPFRNLGIVPTMEDQAPPRNLALWNLEGEVIHTLPDTALSLAVIG